MVVQARLIRDVAYDLQPRARRREGHRHIAEFIEESTPEVGEAGAALARHWRGAGELEHAVKHFVAAAEEAERGWAKQYAVTLYKEALDMTPADDSSGSLPTQAARRRAAGATITSTTRSCSGSAAARA